MKAPGEIYRRTTCRVCQKNTLTEVFSFGQTPLANAFLTKKLCDEPEKFYPLTVCLCSHCSALQLGHVVNPKILFEHYVYASSTSPVFVKHFTDLASSVIRSFGLAKNDLVVDIGSNDGILLAPFRAEGLRVVGIEPAKHFARVAIRAGIPTVAAFLSESVAREIRKTYGPAKLVTATNVFAHIDDLDEILRSVDVLLSEDGVFMIEAPYLGNLLKFGFFDLVYHEHLMHWSLSPLITLLLRFQFRCIDVQHVSSHGGSMRVFFAGKNSTHAVKPAVQSFLKEEDTLHLGDADTYRKFFKGIIANKAKLLSLLTELKEKGKRIVGYGAPAKSTTLLSFFGIGREYLTYVVDDSPYKQGLYTPGTHIPVVGGDALTQDKPDFMLILAWNFAESIMAKNKNFAEKGGKFIIPVPDPHIV